MHCLPLPVKNDTLRHMIIVISHQTACGLQRNYRKASLDENNPLHAEQQLAFSGQMCYLGCKEVRHDFTGAS